MHLNFHDFFLLFIEQKLSQAWPVSAEVDLDDMEYHEGKEYFLLLLDFIEPSFPHTSK